MPVTRRILGPPAFGRGHHANVHARPQHGRRQEKTEFSLEIRKLHDPIAHVRASCNVAAMVAPPRSRRDSSAFSSARRGRRARQPARELLLEVGRLGSQARWAPHGRDTAGGSYRPVRRRPLAQMISSPPASRSGFGARIRRLGDRLPVGIGVKTGRHHRLAIIELDSPPRLIYTWTVKARKLIAILLSIGYLAAAHCRVACAFPVSSHAAVEEKEDDCHHEEGEPKGHDSKAPCCSSGLGAAEALLPSDAPVLAPHAFLVFDVIVPAGSAALPLRLLASSRNHDPPRSATEVLSQSSLSPRAPPSLL